MNQTKTFLQMIMLALLVLLAACSFGAAEDEPSNGAADIGNTMQAAAATSTAVPMATATVPTLITPNTAADAPNAAEWDPVEVVHITLSGDDITAEGAGVTVDGSTVQIISAGTFSFSGSLTNGQIIVNTPDDELVRLILNGVELHSSTSAPIYIADAAEAMLVLADNTQNFISYAADYVPENAEDEPNAAIFSKGDLAISGNGSLSVEGNYNDGIASQDGLVITGGTFTINAVDDGIRGKDYLVVESGNITITAQGDGLKSDNEEDPTLGYISVADGTFNITAAGDAVQAQSNVFIADGEFILSTGGGNQGHIDEDLSAKGLKSDANVKIDGGVFTIDSADDAVHSNSGLVINGSTFALATGDDGIHADATIEINSGNISITKSYEGIESANITINGGDIRLVSSDDGLNGAGGNDGIAIGNGFFLYINGGSIVIDGGGDGIDVNGSIEMTNGIVIVNGPTTRMNAAVDYDASFKITGGFLVGAGSSRMAHAPDESSTQYSLLINLTAVQPAGTLVQIRTAAGHPIVTFAPAKDYQSFVFSSAELVPGATYDLCLGGSLTLENMDGLYQDAAPTSGAKNTTFTVSQMVTKIGEMGRSR